MDRHNEHFDNHVQRLFGPAAKLAGTMGTPKQPGQVRIVLGERPLGIGANFELALAAAQRTAAWRAAANRRGLAGHPAGDNGRGTNHEGSNAV